MKAGRVISVLHVDIEGGYGGSSRSLFELVSYFKCQRTKHKVLIRKDGPIAKKYNDQGIEFEIYKKIFSRVPLRANNWKNFLTGIFYSHHLMMFLVKLLRQKTDFIHFNHDGLAIAAFFVKLFRSSQKTIVHSRYEWPDNFSSRLYSKALIFGADKIIAISHPVKSALVNVGVPSRMIEVHYNTSSTATTSSGFSPNSLEEGEPKLIFLGVLNQIKNPIGMIGLDKELRKLGLAHQILLCGDAPRYRSLTKNLNFEKDSIIEYERSTGDRRFRYLGHVQAPEEEIKKSHFLIRPSSRNDPWGRDIIEAMCLGKVVIATGDCNDIIIHGENGFLLKRWHPEQAAKIVCELCDDPSEYEKICLNAYATAQKLFKPEVASQKFLHLIDNF